MESKKRGRPATGRSPQVNMRLPADELARVDRWRAAMGGVPTRPEAIRYLINLGIKQEAERMAAEARLLDLTDDQVRKPLGRKSLRSKQTSLLDGETK